MDIKVINSDAYLKALADMACGKIRFVQLDSSDFLISPFDARTIDDYTLPENFPACCASHKGRQKILVEWFDEFPACCVWHKKLQSAPWFKKEEYSGVVDKIMRQSQYTWTHVQNCIDKDDWFEDITEYIDYNYSSFGSLPRKYGSAVGVDRYLHFVKIDIGGLTETPKKVPGEKISRLLAFINGYNTQGKQKAVVDLNALDTIYRKWLRAFPFGISYFKGLKEQYEKSFPILNGQPTLNRYSRQAKIGIKTETELVESLIDTTKGLLQKVNSSELYEQGVIEDSKKHTVDLLNESHRVSQMALLGDFSKRETQYVKILKSWLENEQKYFKKLGSLITSSQIKGNAWVPNIQLTPLENEDIFEDFVCDLYNLLDSSAHFEMFGKKGDKQKGIDILSTSQSFAIQCKKKDIYRRGLVKELKADFDGDIKKVLTLDFKISRLLFVSTFQDNAVLVEYLQVLKKRYNLDFDVTYLGWNSLSAKAQEQPAILNRYFNFNLPG